MVAEGSSAERGGGEPLAQDGGLGDLPEQEERDDVVLDDSSGAEPELADSEEPETDEDPEPALREVLHYLVRHIVDTTDAIDVTVEREAGRYLLRLRVDPEDMGKVIGRGGRTARALRSLVRAAGLKYGVTAHVEIVE